MTNTRTRGRIDRLTDVLIPGAPNCGEGVYGMDAHVIEALARWAGTSPAELVAEATRLQRLCVNGRAWTRDARLAVVAAEAAMPVEDLQSQLTSGLAVLERATP